MIRRVTGPSFTGRVETDVIRPGGWIGGIEGVAGGVAVIPAILAVSLLIVGVREPGDGGRPEGSRRDLRLRDARRLPVRYWLVV